MQRLWSLVTIVSRIGVWAGGAMLLIAALIVTAEVVSRKVIGVVFSGSDELAAYLFAVGTSWSMAYVLVTRGHVRIDALWVLLSPRLRAVCDLAALLLLGLFLVVLTERGFALTFDSIEGGNRSNTPLRVLLAIPQTAWFIGIAFFLLTWLLATLRTILALLRGDLAAAAEIAGASTQHDEIGAELDGLGIEYKGRT